MAADGATLDAVDTRVNELDASVILQGTWDASVGSFPGAGVAQAGWSYIVSVGGTVDSVTFVANDRIIAIADNASTTTYAANWHQADYTDAVLSVVGLTGIISKAGLLTAINVSDGATVGATWGSSVTSQPSVISQAEAEAGTATTERMFTAQRVAQAIAALAAEGGGGDGTAYATLEADFSTSSGSYVLVDNGSGDILKVAMEADKSYIVHVAGSCKSAAVGTAPEIALEGPTGEGNVSGILYMAGSVNAIYQMSWQTSYLFDYGGANGPLTYQPFFMTFRVENGSTAGDLEVHLRSETASTAVYIGSDTWMSITEATEDA